MFGLVQGSLKRLASTKSVGNLLIYGFIIRLIVLIYGIIHDRYINHIKYTDIDYHVFTDGSRAILSGKSPYIGLEYRYSPLVAVIFVPNILLDQNLGKLILIAADVFCGHLHYKLNIYQGANRLNSKIFLILWLINPLTIGISTRGSFEPVLTLVILASMCSLIETSTFIAGLLYGLAIHLKLYPIIYTLSIYIFLIQKKPFIRTQTKMDYWIKTVTPNANHLKFFLSTAFSFGLSTYISYRYYGQEYLEESFLYHLRRKDLQHNFSIYFYLFRLMENSQELISTVAFIIQFLGLIALSIMFSGFDTNRRTKLKKLTFSLFSTTFLFVSFNKVCTSQYFIWYLTFLPLIIDSIRMSKRQVYLTTLSWILTQVNWLMFAYLYEYQHLDVLHLVGCSSIVFLISNVWILTTLCKGFDVTTKWQLKEDTRED